MKGFKFESVHLKVIVNIELLYSCFCLSMLTEDTTNGRIVEYLLNNGADIWQNSEYIIPHPTMDPYKQDIVGVPAFFSGTAGFYTLARDESHVFMTLWRHGLGERISVEELARVAIIMEATSCLSAMLSNGIISKDNTRMANQCLLVASVTDHSVVQVLVDSGITYNRNFLLRYPDILRRIYERFESRAQQLDQSGRGCKALTAVVLEQSRENGLDICLDRDAVVSLIKRFSFVKEISDYGKHMFYRDIIDTFDILVTHKPNLYSEISDAVENLTDIWLAKYQHGNLTLAHEAEHLAEMTLLLLENGLRFPCTGKCFLGVVLRLSRFHLTKRIPMTSTLASHFSRLVVHALEGGCQPDMTLWGPEPVILTLWKSLFDTDEGDDRYTCTCESGVVLVSSITSLLCNAGMPLDRKCEYSLPPRDAFTLQEEHISTTYLQTLLQYLTDVKGELQTFLLMLASLITRLTTSGSDFSVSMLSQLLWKSFLNLHTHHARNRGYIGALSKMFKALLQRMTVEERNKTVEWFQMQRNSFLLFDDNGDQFSEMNLTIDLEIMPVVQQPTSLAESCRLFIIRHVNIQQTEQTPTRHAKYRNIPRRQHCKYPNEVNKEITNRSDDDFVGYGDTALWDRLGRNGVYPRGMMSGVLSLPLPRDLQWYVGASLEEETMRDVFTVLTLDT